MIHIFFDCGSFGSTIEYVIRNFSNHKLGPVDGCILPNGSMHSFRKQHHLSSLLDVDVFLKASKDPEAITTPIYPAKEYKLPEILEKFAKIPTWQNDKKILIYQPNLQAAELNLLFKYYKVCLANEIDFIVGDNQHNLSGWDPTCTHWKQLCRWQLREWLSLFYPGLSKELCQSRDQVDHTWLKITNTDILHNTKQIMHDIIDFCGLKVIKNLDGFVRRWQDAQKYIVDEFNLLDQIVYDTLHDKTLKWQPLNIIAESIIQQRLRQLGWEIRCDGLDVFPTHSKQLYNILEKV